MKRKAFSEWKKPFFMEILAKMVFCEKMMELVRLFTYNGLQKKIKNVSI